jgi:hypothetical protein
MSIGILVTSTLKSYRRKENSPTVTRTIIRIQKSSHKANGEKQFMNMKSALFMTWQSAGSKRNKTETVSGKTKTRFHGGESSCRV